MSESRKFKVAAADSWSFFTLLWRTVPFGDSFKPKITTLNFLSEFELVRVVEGEAGLGEGRGEVFAGSIGELVIGLLGEDKWGSVLTFWETALKLSPKI